MNQTIQLRRPDGHLKTLDEIIVEVIAIYVGMSDTKIHAAKRLGIGRSTLYRILAKHVPKHAPVPTQATDLFRASV